MTKLRVHNFAVSIDGYGAGSDQSVDAPLGVGAERMHEWIFETRTGRTMIGEPGGETGVDDDFIAAGFEGIDATIMGRNMFGPVRGEWGESDWTGWWGDDPPFHHPVFVLTHHARPSIEMQGGTTFHFVADGIEAARDRAFDAAGDADVRLGGGVSTVQQYLRAGLVDEVHLAITPVLLGRGERLFEHVDGAEQRYECVDVVRAPSRVVHVTLARRSG
jgi:dihydrofolate reductase